MLSQLTWPKSSLGIFSLGACACSGFLFTWENNIESKQFLFQPLFRLGRQTWSVLLPGLRIPTAKPAIGCGLFSTSITFLFLCFCALFPLSVLAFLLLPCACVFPLSSSCLYHFLSLCLYSFLHSAFLFLPLPVFTFFPLTCATVCVLLNLFELFRQNVHPSGGQSTFDMCMLCDRARLREKPLVLICTQPRGVRTKMQTTRLDQVCF